MSQKLDLDHDFFCLHILGPLVPPFRISGEVPSRFQSQSGFCLICIVEVNVIDIPPLVLHVANLLTDSTVGCQPGSYLAQGYYWHPRGSNPRS